MQTPLTTHLIIKNDEAWIEEALQSILPLDGQILVADIGSKDATPYICEKYGAAVIRLALKGDMSQVRNRMASSSKQPWNLYLEPWEKILAGAEEIQQVCLTTPTNKLFRMSIVQDEIITKENRLWHRTAKAEFLNPVNEMLAGDAHDIGSIIHRKKHTNRDEQNAKLLEDWKAASPLNTTVMYLEACNLLTRKNWKGFLSVANHYLFQEKKDLMPTTMIRYYVAMVLCSVFKDFDTATKQIVACLSVKPLMAEYWCLLGDIYYKKKRYEQARVFYENALDLGRKRQPDDWPMDVPKYRKYPQEMVRGCTEILDKSRDYLG